MNRVSLVIGFWLLATLCLADTAHTSATTSVARGIKLLNSLQYYRVKTTNVPVFDLSMYDPQIRPFVLEEKKKGTLPESKSVDFSDYVYGMPVYTRSTINGKTTDEWVITDDGVFRREKSGPWHKFHSDGSIPIPKIVTGSTKPLGKGNSPIDCVATFVRVDKINGASMNVYKSLGDEDDASYVQVFWLGVTDGILHREELQFAHDTFIYDYYDFNVPTHHTTPLVAKP